MKHIHQKTLDDLEFPEILHRVSELCITSIGKYNALKIKPFKNKEHLKKSLHCTNEYLSSIESNTPIPSHNFEAVSNEIKLLHIDNSSLDTFSFLKIRSISQTINQHITFFNKFKDYFPNLYSLTKHIIFIETIPIEINKIFNNFSEIKNEASPLLFELRKQIAEVKLKINQSFNYAMSQYLASDFLDDIRESVIENRRVLAVKAMFKKKVKGTILGYSKTGSIAYIEPFTTEHLSRELHNLINDEQQEIKKILKKLTDFLRPFANTISSYQHYLIEIDVISAKALFAQKTQSILPQITQDRNIILQDAIHPLLYLNNLKHSKPTFSQTILLNDQSRIIVISGPNAGGKSITLKTIGLIQLMLQSGMLVPVHHKSQMYLFEQILTDIGDNQSIENQLSTYSYRLKNMNYFLRKCNNQTLFLIDEFGTGSDPELGGALAETFLEEFYHRQAFGVITTHYANLKILANELPFVINANMSFNKQSLEPMFKLFIGEPGSSFTFEVAQKNGIPFGLINRAKKKIEHNKIRFDTTIAKLQKERDQMEKTTKSLKDQRDKTQQETQKLEELNNKTQLKLENYQLLYDQNQRQLNLGKKIDDLAQKYSEKKNRRMLIGEFLKIIETENHKRKPQTPKEKQQLNQINKQILKEISVIREEKKQTQREKEILIKKEKEAQLLRLKIKDKVRVKGSSSIGSIEKIEKDKIAINYGNFLTWTTLSELELVERKK